MYRTTFTVRGNGYFPTDMMRYDRATPLTQEDVSLLHENKITRNINMIRYHKYKESGGFPTKKRWESFGWEVTRVNTEKVL
jgi:hypothetical protein